MSSQPPSDPYEAGNDEASQQLIKRTYYTITTLNTLAVVLSLIVESSVRNQSSR